MICGGGGAEGRNVVGGTSYVNHRYHQGFPFGDNESRWTGEQRGFAVKTCFQNGESFVQIRRIFRRNFKIQRNPSLFRQIMRFERG